MCCVDFLDLHTPLGSGGGLGEVLGNCVRVKEWTRVEETKMCCTEKGLDWRAEESLMHIFDPVLYVCDGVNIVCLMWGGWRWCGWVCVGSDG